MRFPSARTELHENAVSARTNLHRSGALAARLASILLGNSEGLPLPESREPILVAYPPFYGFTRRVILSCAVVYVLAAILVSTSPAAADWLINNSCLHPGESPKMPWQFLTYPFIAFGLVSFVLALLSFWFFGSALEDERGSRWLGEFFFFSSICGALVSVTLSHTLLRSVSQLGPEGRMSGLWPIIMAMTLAYARLFPRRELRLYWFIPIRAKFFAAIYLIIYLGATISSGHRFDAMTTIFVCFFAFVYLRFAPRRGLRFAGSELLFGIRNRLERGRRRRAAKKFTVYMKKQGKDVNLDASGKYVSLDDETRDSRDRKWMN